MMGNLVVKSNALIEASYTLDVVEQRIVLLAILEARALGVEITAGRKLQIRATSYAEHYGISLPMAYNALKHGVQGLYEAEFRWTEMVNSTIKHHQSRFVDSIAYADGLGYVELVFGSQVIPQITDLTRLFTSYEIEQTKHLNRYGLRLYELLIKWRSTGKTEFIDIEKLRNQLGLLPNEYKIMGDFKKRVLDKGISEINERTDIMAKYEQHKQGRTIIGFTFKFKQKDKPKQNLERDPNTIDWVNGQTDNEAKKAPSWQIKGLSDGQIGKLAIYMKEFIDANSSKISPNDRRDYAPIFEVWKPMLKDPMQVGGFHKIQELLDRQRVN